MGTKRRPNDPRYPLPVKHGAWNPQCKTCAWRDDGYREPCRQCVNWSQYLANRVTWEAIQAQEREGEQSDDWPLTTRKE